MQKIGKWICKSAWRAWQEWASQTNCSFE